MDLQTLTAVASAIVAIVSSSVAIWAAHSARQQAKAALDAARSADRQVEIAREQLRLSQVSDSRSRKAAYYTGTNTLIASLNHWSEILTKILVDDDFQSDSTKADLEKLDEARVRALETWKNWLPLKSDGPFSNDVEVIVELVRRLVMKVDDRGLLVSRIFELDPSEARFVAAYAQQTGNYTLDLRSLTIQIINDLLSLSGRISEWAANPSTDPFPVVKSAPETEQPVPRTRHRR